MMKKYPFLSFAMHLFDTKRETVTQLGLRVDSSPVPRGWQGCRLNDCFSFRDDDKVIFY